MGIEKPRKKNGGTSFCFFEDQESYLHEFAKMEGVSLSHAIRYAIDFFIKKHPLDKQRSANKGDKKC